MKKVITYGTFDLFHQGHYNILKRAKELGDYLIVGVTSEIYDIERGKLNVKDDLVKRIRNVKKTGFADEIIIEEYQGQKINDILKYDIDVLVVGSDWIGKFDYLKEYCEVVYLERTKDISSTQIRIEHGKTYKLGIATDKQEDNDLVLESKFVSGIHVEGVYCEDIISAETFQKKYELNLFTDNYDLLMDNCDIIYVDMPFEKRFLYIERAVERKKKIIASSPIILDSDALLALFQKCVKKKALICENIILAYLRAFNQLVWLVRGNLIGKIVSVHCSISQRDFSLSTDAQDILPYAIFSIIKLLGKEYDSIHSFHTKGKQGRAGYQIINILYNNALALIEIGEDLAMDNFLKIIGENGTILVPNEWWNIGYFEANIQNVDKLKRYSFNFEGNGYRYLMQEMVSMIASKRNESCKIFFEESLAIAEILKEINKEL